MSSQSSSHFSSSTFTSSSSSSSSNGQQTRGHQTTTHRTTDPSTGTTTVSQTSQNLGEAPQQTITTYDNSSGRQLINGGGNGGSRIQDVTDEEQAKRDAEYEERIEEEYAKREGGA